MLTKIRRAFTKWYIKRGYRFGYDIGSNAIKAYWICPFWVKPLRIFFSPSIYFASYMSENIAKWVQEGIERGIKEAKSKENSSKNC